MNLIIPEEVIPDYEPVNAVTSILKISPDIEKMEQKVNEMFWEDPRDYMQKATVINKQT